MKVSEARENVGGLSNPSKMPSKSYGLPAQACKVGGQLRSVKGSTCENCYAYDRGMYGFPVVKKAQARRLATITREDWAPSMARAINKDKYFRWHDSGDIQDLEHFDKIVKVARATPDCLHWLPTREAQTVASYDRRRCLIILIVRVIGRDGRRSQAKAIPEHFNGSRSNHPHQFAYMPST